MKYPISINDKELEVLKKIGLYMGIKDIHNHYGAIPKIIKFSINLTLTTINNISKAIPTLHPDILEILLLSIKRKKVNEYHRKKRELKQKKA